MRFIKKSITLCCLTFTTAIFAHTKAENIIEYLTFSLDSKQPSTCSAPPPLAMTVIHDIDLSKSNTPPKVHFILNYRSPYSSVTNLAHDTILPGNKVEHYTDKATISADGRVIFMEGICNEAKHINSGTWKDAKGCHGSFVDKMTE